MKIGNVNIKAVYKAYLLKYSIGVPELNAYSFIPGNTVRPVRLTGRVGVRNISVTYEFVRTSDAVAAHDMSDFINEVINGSELDIEDGYIYHYVIDSIESPERISEGIFDITFNMNGYRHGSTITAALTTGSANDINVAGNIPAPAIFSLAGGSGAYTIAYGGKTITVSGSYRSSTMIIDGIGKKVLYGSANGWSGVTMTEFPVLSTGTVSITPSGTGTLTLQYQPVYY